MSELYVDRKNDVWTAVPKSISNVFPFQLRPGLTEYSLAANTELDVFKLFLTSSVCTKIISATNAKGAKLFAAKWIPLNDVEFYAFLGEFITIGAIRSAKQSVDELWSLSDAFAPPILQAAMGKSRFVQLKRCLCFADPNSIEQERARGNTDRLLLVRDIHDEIAATFEKAYTIGPDVTIDEQLMSFRGKIPARQYMPKKPGKYGQKRWVLSCAYTGYCWRWQVYLGMQNNEREMNLAFRVVKDLTRDMQPGYHITTDNFYTSETLASYLYKRGILLTGTMRMNKRELPPIIRDKQNRELYSTNFAYKNELMLASYCPKENHVVVLLSSQNQLSGIQPHNNEKKKPNIILRYNKTKGGVDLFDKIIKEYSCRKASKKWTVNFFLHEIDAICTNAWIVWAVKQNLTQGQRKNMRKSFMKSLALQLMTPFMRQRHDNVIQVPREIRKRIANILNIHPSYPPLNENQSNVHSIGQRPQFESTMNRAHYYSGQEPNCIYVFDVGVVAIRDILDGEELVIATTMGMPQEYFMKTKFGLNEPTLYNNQATDKLVVDQNNAISKPSYSQAVYSQIPFTLKSKKW